MNPFFCRTLLAASLILSRIALATDNPVMGPVPSPLPDSTSQLLKKHRINSNELGFMAIDLDTKEVLASHNIDHAFMPASVTKIPSTLMALTLLGADYRFETDLLYSGTLENGVLKGDVILRGKGDPVLTAGELFNLAQHLAATGIKKVSGRFIADATYLITTPIIDPGGEKDQTYNTGVSALSSEFNRFKVFRYGRSRRTSKSSFEVSPPMPWLEVTKTSERFSPGLKYRHQPEKKNEAWEVSNLQRYVRSETLPVRDPTGYTAEFFRYLSSLLGVELPPHIKMETPKNTRLLYKNLSSPLSEIVESTLEYSNNLLAELLLLRAARKLKQRKTSIREAAEICLDWYKTQFQMSSWENIHFENGSGMTPNNRMTPRFMTSVLGFAHKKQFGARHFWSLLSISGWKGWLQKRLNEPKTAFRVWAKTGSLDFASALAGYILADSGKKVAFGIFVSDFEHRKQIDEGSAADAKKARAHSPKWKWKAQSVQDDLVRQWISKF